MKPLHFNRPVVIPAVLAVYLVVMAYIGRGEFLAGNYLYYFGIIGASLVCIVLLHFSLKRRDRLRREREADMEKARSAGGGDDSVTTDSREGSK